MRRCDACEFWVLLEHQDMKRHVDDFRGDCRRRAPSPFNHDVTYELLKHLTHLSWNACTEEERAADFEGWEDAGHNGSCSWPPTTGSDWCGEFSKKQAGER
jgi:hypothetical protein